MRTRACLLVVAAAAGLAAFAPAQEPKSSLPADVVPATFRAFLVSDGRFPPVNEDGKTMPDPRDRTGKIHCLVCEYGLAPVVAVFVRAEAKAIGAEKGVARLVKSLNAMIPKFRSDKLAGFVMFLNLDGGKKTIKIPGAEGGTDTSLTVDKEYPDDVNRDAYAAAIRDLDKALNAPYVPFGLAATKSDAAAAWKIGEKDDVTVIIYHRMRVVGKPWSFARLDDLTDARVDEILKAAEAAITGRK
jgi:hypothetical protein